MRRFLTLLLLLGTTLVLAPVPAQANATPSCITKREFRAIKQDMTMKRVRNVVGARGRVTSSISFSDGDGWRTLEFRQCGRRWSRSYVSVDVEKTEREVYVSDLYCDDYGCEDYGYWETRYRKPFRVTSKSAYWS